MGGARSADWEQGPRFADSPLEQAGFEPSVPLKSQAEPDLVLPEHLP
jgi:hypothetical protein